MKYAYENLGDEQFETLIVLLCQKLLGIGTHGFSKGKDGGRDAKFVGTAELHPSKAAPWIGTTIIQSKHTNGYNKNFSETDFYSSKPDTESILSEEIPRIKKLYDSKELHHYMLFANRRLAGAAAEWSERNASASQNSKAGGSAARLQDSCCRCIHLRFNTAAMEHCEAVLDSLFPRGRGGACLLFSRDKRRARSVVTIIDENTEVGQ